MSQSTLVTVICTCYNHADFVTKSLISVLDQSYKNVQLIVVDDFSSDNSVTIIDAFISNYPQIIFIKNKSNIGITKSFNNVVKLAKGDYIIDLSADDVLLPNCIETQIRTFENSKFKNLAIVYGNVELISENGNHISYYFDINENFKTKTKRPSGDIYYEVISPITTICGVSALVNKKTFDTLLGYDENLSYEDFDFWIRTSREYDIEFINEILAQKRIVSNSLHASFNSIKNRHGYSTNIILKKPLKLNKNKKENRILLQRIIIEIKIALKTKNYRLVCLNVLLFLKAGYKSI